IMPTYKYTAKSLTGEAKNGTLDAASEGELARLLREQGFLLTFVQANVATRLNRQWLKEALTIFSSVSLFEKIIFVRHLAVMVGAGLAISRALETLSLQTTNQNFSKILQAVNNDVRQGQPLADSFNKHPKVFSELFVNMVKVGETSGSLENVLKLLAEQLEKEHELKSKIRGAMMYPAIIVLAMIGIGILMMIMVVPQLTAVFKDMGSGLPLSTQLIISFSDFLSQYWLLFLVALAATIFLIRFLLKTPLGRRVFDRVWLRLPIFGNISRKTNSARLARTLGSLVESGVPIVSGLQIVSGTLTNIFFQQSLAEAAVQVQRGSQLSKIIQGFNNLYPPIVSQMISVGEETGTLGEILIKLAGFYEEEVSNITKNLSTIIEPVLMVFIGIVVGFFAIAMLQPMYSMMNSI
ncbi:MAG: type II secretion system F family protein, partial [Patescibacteria group bacterium]